MTPEDIPRLNRAAHAKAIAAGAESMTEAEFWEWAETLPKDEAIAMLVTLAEMSDAERADANH